MWFDTFGTSRSTAKLINKLRAVFLALAVLAFGISTILPAQTPDTSTVQGQIDDPNHRAVSGATITVKNTLSGLARTVETDTRGKFSVSGLPIAGSYDVLAVKSGFAEAHLSEITLVGGVVADIHLHLNLASSLTSVTVTGVAGEVRADAPQLGDRLGAHQMEETPLLNRRITYLPLLNAANRPALNQGDAFMNQNLFTTNGSGRRQTWFEVDGGNGIDSWGRQTIFTNIPMAAVGEMTVIENAFSAEYGFGLGGVVNIVTKSGVNQFHGEALGSWRPSGPEAKLSGFLPAGGFRRPSCFFARTCGADPVPNGKRAGHKAKHDECNHAPEKCRRMRNPQNLSAKLDGQKSQNGETDCARHEIDCEQPPQ